MRKRPGIVAGPWETSVKVSPISPSSARRSIWTARWVPADDQTRVEQGCRPRKALSRLGCFVDQTRTPFARPGNDMTIGARVTYFADALQQRLSIALAWLGDAIAFPSRTAWPLVDLLIPIWI